MDLIDELNKIASQDCGSSYNPEEEHICGIAAAELLRLRKELVLVSKLASDKPEFYRPIDSLEAQKVRDKVLREAK